MNRRTTYSILTGSLLAATAMACMTGAQAAQPTWPMPPLAASAETVAHDTLVDALAAVTSARGATATVTIAAPDARRAPAPCNQFIGFMPPGARLVGRTLVGVRCADGSTWQTFLAAEVRVDAPVWQATRALKVGEPLAAGDVVPAVAILTPADVDAATSSGRAGSARALATLDGRMPAPFGRTVQRPVGVGRALTAADVREEGRVNAGESVRVVYQGPGFAVASEGRTVGAADPGATVQIRLAGGAVVNGTLRADRQVELAH